MCFNWIYSNVDLHTYLRHSVFLWNRFFIEVKAERTVEITGVPRVQSLLSLIKFRVYGTYCDVLTPCILDLCTRRRRLVGFTLRPLHPRSQNTGIRWLQSWVRLVWPLRGTEIFLTPAGNRIQTPRFPVHSLLNIHSEDMKFMQEGSRFCGSRSYVQTCCLSPSA